MNLNKNQQKTWNFKLFFMLSNEISIRYEISIICLKSFLLSLTILFIKDQILSSFTVSF